MSESEINSLTAKQLVDILHSLPSYKHKILYYGPQPMAQLTAKLNGLHSIPSTWATTPTPIKFDKIEQTENRVFFTNYDMVQSEIYWYRKLENFDTSKFAKVNLFNSYFGGGMGSVVFQTIREAKALAYSTSAFVTSPDKKDGSFGFVGYVGSQADKHDDAIHAMNELINTMPLNPNAYSNAVGTLKKDIETDRITKTSILFTYLGLEKQGINYDFRKS
ncbi:MAG: peptidase M16, partial [Pseudopedobacter saltans]